MLNTIQLKSININLKKMLLDYAIYMVLGAMIIILAIISPQFFSITVFRDILMQSSTRIIIALGCMFIIIAGGADLSGGRMVGFAAVISGSLAQSSSYYNRFFPNLPEMPIIVPILVAISVGALFGLFNGLIVSKLNVPAFIATLGTSMIIYGFNCLYFNLPPNNSQPLGGFVDSFRNLGSGSVVGIPYILITAVICMIVVYIIQRKTCLGKEIFAVGGNPNAAKVSGINIVKIQLIAYSIAGSLYAIGGILEAARTGSATSTYGTAYELDAIASCIVGGCSITGGVGTVPGVFVGVIIFNVISYGLTFIGISPYWQNVVKGLIIVGAVAIDIRKYGKK